MERHSKNNESFAISQDVADDDVGAPAFVRLSFNQVLNVKLLHCFVYFLTEN